MSDSKTSVELPANTTTRSGHREAEQSPAARPSEVQESESLEPQPVEIERMANKLKSVSGTDDARITVISSLALVMMMRKRTMLPRSAVRCPFLRFLTMSKCVISKSHLKTLGVQVDREQVLRKGEAADAAKESRVLHARW